MEFDVYNVLDTLAVIESNGFNKGAYESVIQGVIETYGIEVWELEQYKEEFCYSKLSHYIVNGKWRWDADPIDEEEDE